MVTGYDIIFFWVARMIMAGLEFTGRGAFPRHQPHDHRARQAGPQDVQVPGQRHRSPRDRRSLRGGRAQVHPRLPLHLDAGHPHRQGRLQARLQVREQDLEREPLHPHEPRGPRAGEADPRAARHRPVGVRPPRRGLRGHPRGARRPTDTTTRPPPPTNFWNDFCDWYLEATKLSFRAGPGAGPADDAEKDRAVSVLIDVLEQSLALLHPFLPFVTEEIFQKLPGRKREAC